MDRKQDLRIVKTKKSIYEAFLKLLSKYTFEEIKVSQICDAALINRSTFYSHFEDKFTLLNSLINDLRDNLKSELDKNKKIVNSKEYYMELIKLLLNHVEEQKDIYIALMLNNRNSIAMDMLHTTLKEDVMRNLKVDKISEVPKDFICNFYIGAIFNVGMEWIADKDRCKKEEIFEYLDRLIPEDIF